MREVTEKSLKNVNRWCKKSVLKLSHLKINWVMFKKRRNWSFRRPLIPQGRRHTSRIAKPNKVLKYLLRLKLSWDELIENVCKKSKGILMHKGKRWPHLGLQTCWISEVIVRPVRDNHLVKRHYNTIIICLMGSKGKCSYNKRQEQWLKGAGGVFINVSSKSTF